MVASVWKKDKKIFAATSRRSLSCKIKRLSFLVFGRWSKDCEGISDSRINVETIVINNTSYVRCLVRASRRALGSAVHLMASCQADTIHTINTAAHHCPILAHRIFIGSFRSVRPLLFCIFPHARFHSALL